MGHFFDKYPVSLANYMTESLSSGDDPHHDYAQEIKEAATATPPPSPGDSGLTQTEAGLGSALETAVNKLAVSREKMTEPRTPPSSPSYRNRAETVQAFDLAKSGSTDSAVEATEEVLEDLQEKCISSAEEEKENIPGHDIQEEKSSKSVEPNCDNPCDSEIRKSDLSSSTPSSCTKKDEAGDRRNLAEIKI